jgi:3-methylcrotonyl-CoA carboxylase alpha subunit
MQLTFQLGEEKVALQVEPADNGWRVRLPSGAERTIQARRLTGDILQIADGDRAFQVAFARSRRGIEVSYGGTTYVFSDTPARRAGRKQQASSGALVAPMAGVVADVLVREGDTVQTYQPVVVVAAMKVYATVETPFAGAVKAVHVAKDQRVEHGALLVEIATADEEKPSGKMAS